MGKWATVKNQNDDFLWNEGLVGLFLRSSKTGTYFWVNQKPGGSEHLRPLKKSTEKDTAEEVLASVRAFERARDSLTPLTVVVGGKTVTVSYTVQPSMYDGAVIKVTLSP